MHGDAAAGEIIISHLKLNRVLVICVFLAKHFLRILKYFNTINLISHRNKYNYSDGLNYITFT